MKKLPVLKPNPDINRFCQTIRGEIIPERPPFVELFLDWQIHKRICEEYLDRPYAYYDKNNLEQRAAYWDNYI